MKPNKYELYFAYACTAITAPVCFLVVLEKWCGADIRQGLAFIAVTWYWWLIYAVMSLVGYTFWYWWKYKRGKATTKQ